jgi:hypothetical protein
VGGQADGRKTLLIEAQAVLQRIAKADKGRELDVLRLMIGLVLGGVRET